MATQLSNERISRLRQPLALATFLLLAFAPLGAMAEPEAPYEPTSAGTAIIGFFSGFAPTLAEGQLWRTLHVEDVSVEGSFIVVEADNLADVRRATVNAPGVSYVEDNPVAYAIAVPNDSQYSSQYGPEMMGAHTAWNEGFGDDSVIVAVLDTGIRRTHQDFQSARILQGYDYSNNDNNPDDDCGHGTHVAGTVAATTNNGIGVAGMAQATILPMKVLSPGGALGCSGSHDDIAQAIIDSTNQGAHIISMSLGGTTGSSTLENAVNYAWNNGALVVAAAGNDGPCFVGCVGYPAGYTNALAVSALDDDKGLAFYSSSGSQVEIAAPGSDVLSTHHNSNADYSSMSGTSMAAPHVAGAFALALACDPSLTNGELRNLMANNAEDLGSNGRDSSYGHGLMRIDWMLNQLTCGGASNSAPTASFTHSETALTTSVDGSGSSDPDGDALSYSWTFGDGASGSGATASHAYGSAGTYTVTLTVNDGNGGSDSDSQSITVAAANSAPTASFSHSENGLTTSVDGSGSSDPDGDSLSYSWTFGDGASGSGATASRTYGSAGTYTVTLTVSDGNGGSDSASASVTVSSGGSGSVCDSDPDPATPNLEDGTAETVNVANKAFTHRKICVPEDATSLASSTTGVNTNCGFLCTLDADLFVRYNAKPTTSAYTCSDETSSNSEACTVSPTTAGWYYVSAYGYSGSGTVSLLANHDGSGSPPPANNPPTASFSHSVSDLTVSVDGSGSSDPDGDSLSYSWTFGDGASGSGATASHTYGSAGTFTVTLTVSDGNGGSDSASASVTVTAPPPPTGCSGGENVGEMQNGQSASMTVASGGWQYRKICVPAGESVLEAAMTGPACSGFLGCTPDIDLYLRAGALPTTGSYDCNSAVSGNSESCDVANPTDGWWYVGAYSYSGSATVNVTLTHS